MPGNPGLFRTRTRGIGSCSLTRLDVKPGARMDAIESQMVPLQASLAASEISLVARSEASEGSSSPLSSPVSTSLTLIPSRLQLPIPPQILHVLHLLIPLWLLSQVVRTPSRRRRSATQIILWSRLILQGTPLLCPAVGCSVQPRAFLFVLAECCSPSPSLVPLSASVLRSAAPPHTAPCGFPSLWSRNLRGCSCPVTRVLPTVALASVTRQLCPKRPLVARSR